MLAGTYHGIYSSADDGSSWVLADSSIKEVHALHVIGDEVLAAGVGGVFRSTDDGGTWSPVGETTNFKWAQALTSVGDILFVGGKVGNIYRSTDRGVSWTSCSPGVEGIIRTFAVSGNTIFAGLDGKGGGVYYSSDLGASWKRVSDSLATKTVRAFAVTQSYLYVGAGPEEAGIWRLPLSDVISNVDANELGDIEPSSVSISPNPLDAGTNISFTLPQPGPITLNIFNTQGECLATLLSVHCDAGPFSMHWDASSFQTGLYYVQLQVEGLVTSTSVHIVR